METATATAESTQASTEQEPGTTGQQTTQTTQAAGQEPTGERLEDLPPWAQKVVRDARQGEAKARTDAKAQAATEAAEQARQELTQKLGKALGLVKDDQEQADPAQLTAQMTSMAEENRTLTVKVAIYEAAEKLGANAKALTDSVSFMRDLSKLDPSADGFEGKVREAMKKKVDESPTIYRAAGQAPARSGGEFTGGPGGDAVTPEQFKRMSVAQRNELFQRDPTTYRKLAGR